MKQFFFLAVLLIASTVSAQSLEVSAPSPRFEKNLVGLIGAGMKIHMNLAGTNGWIKGSYSYDTRKKPLRLEGSVNKSGFFQLAEFDSQDKMSGYFTGAFTRDNCLVGYWSKDQSLGTRLPFRLGESVTAAANYKFITIDAAVRNDRGGATFWLINDEIVAFQYINVGGGGHTCTLIVERSDKDTSWRPDPSGFKLTFNSAAGNGPAPGFSLGIRRQTQGFEVSFTGDGSYYCGMRAVLPGKVVITKAANVWTGRAVKQAN